MTSCSRPSEPTRREEEETQPCPECGSPMTKGQMQGGLSHGRWYWACTNYPKCRYIDQICTSEEEAFLDALRKIGGGSK